MPFLIVIDLIKAHGYVFQLQELL